MSKTTSLIIGLIAFAGHAMAQQPLYKQATAPVEDRVKDLIGRMTVEEKSRPVMLSAGVGNVYQNDKRRCCFRPL